MLTALLLAGCAGATDKLVNTPSAEIKAAPKSELPYAARSCRDLAAKLQETETDLAARSEANDLRGEGSRGAIADLKGTRDVIQKVMARNGCPPQQG